jgi:hypothetical protein
MAVIQVWGVWVLVLRLLALVHPFLRDYRRFHAYCNLQALWPCIPQEYTKYTKNCP